MITEVEITRYMGYFLFLLFIGPVALVAIFNMSFIIQMTCKEFKKELICRITGKEYGK